MPFSFEKLSVYKKSLILLEEIEEMSKTLKGKKENPLDFNTLSRMDMIENLS